jgi:hypothetical protein
MACERTGETISDSAFWANFVGVAGQIRSTAGGSFPNHDGSLRSWQLREAHTRSCQLHGSRQRKNLIRLSDRGIFECGGDPLVPLVVIAKIGLNGSSKELS